MIQIKHILIFLAATGLLFAASCIKYDYETPDKKKYLVDFEANKTINELKGMYGDSLTPITEDIIIAGTVVADDQSGNLYKKIILQDSTGSIIIGLNAYELHNMYGIGDLVFVKCKGLYLGEYGKVVQLGSDYNGSVGRIEEPVIETHLYKSDGGMPIKPEVITFNQFNSSKINTLIKLENVQFKNSEIGGTFADGINHIDYNRMLETCDGSTMIVKTSGYCDFANDSIPKGNGTFIGILGSFNGKYQLIVRNPNELEMTGLRCGPSFSEDFENGLGQFKTHNIKGDNNSWTQGIHSGVTYAKMTGYYTKKREESEDWLVSKPIDLTITQSPVLKFNHTVNYSYEGWENDIKVLVSTDYNNGNPTQNGTWTELTGFQMPTGSDWTFVPSGDIDLTSFENSKNFRIAFVYTSPANKACTWEIDWVKIENK